MLYFIIHELQKSVKRALKLEDIIFEFLVPVNFGTDCPMPNIPAQVFINRLIHNFK